MLWTGVVGSGVQRRSASGGRSATVMGSPLGCRTGVLFPKVSATMAATQTVEYALHIGKSYTAQISKPLKIDCI